MDVLALSSGESELGALTKACTEGMGMQSLLADFQIQVDVKVLSDATAALGMVRRLGLVKVRHLAVADLWVQERQRFGNISHHKVLGRENPADAMTKGIEAEAMIRHLKKMGFVESCGRHRLAPQLTQTTK